MNATTMLIVPLACLAIEVDMWRLVRRQGWNRVLPIFSSYVVFYCVGSAIVLASLYLTAYASLIEMGKYLLYWYVWSAMQILLLIFVPTVIYELLAYTSRGRPDVPWRLIGVLTGIALEIILIAGLVGAFRSEASSVCAFLVKFAGIVGRAGSLLVLGLLLLFFWFKKIFALQWGTSISLVVSGLAFLYIADLIVELAEHQVGTIISPNLADELIGLVWLVIWWIAVRRGPPLAAFGEPVTTLGMGL